MAFHVGDAVVEVDSAEVMAIIVEGGLLERGEIGVAEVDMVGLPVVEEVDSDSNRYADVRFGFSCSFKDVRANCFCASLLRTRIHMPRHATSCIERAR